MAIYGKPSPRSNVGDLFRRQLEQLQEHNVTERNAILNSDNPQWYRPADWDSSIFDIQSYHEPFSRTQHEQEFMTATTDANAPGTTGDLAMCAIQGDWLHVMERAFRSRHMSACRTRIQPSCRKWGHSHPNGVIKQGLLGYIVNLDRLNKGEQV